MRTLRCILAGTAVMAVLWGGLGISRGAQPNFPEPGKMGRLACSREMAQVAGGAPVGDLLLSRSVYSGTASTVTVGQTLPGGGTAVANGSYPDVFNNAPIDGSFGVTSPILIDRNALIGTTLVPVGTLAVPTDKIVTSFSSKSELALHLSTNGRKVTFMGYVSPINALDVSNSNSPGHVDPTNPVAQAIPRAVAEFDAQGLSNDISVTPVNAYSGNNGRSAILDHAHNQYLMTGNAGNGASPEPINIVNNTGVQLVARGGGPETTVVGIQQGTPGAANGFQFGFAVQLLGNPSDKSGKDDNYRGLTVFDNTLYVTKGSGGNGINTVYQVGSPGTLPTAATAPTTSISILPGFSTVLAKAKSGVTNPFGLFFANSTTLYVADEGSGTAGPNPNAGIGKWVLMGGVWTNLYTLQNGLNHGIKYNVPGLDPKISPAPDGIRGITGRINGDGTVTLFGITSTVSASGDQGADPNQLVTITDTISFTTAAQASLESFSVLKTAGFAEVLRGVQFVPLSGRRYALQLVGAALKTLEALPDGAFASEKEERELEKGLKGVLRSLRDGELDQAEDKLDRLLGDTDSILDSAARSSIVSDLKSAAGALPEDKERHRDDEGRDEE